MSFNGTIASTEMWSSVWDEAQKHLPSSTPRLALLAFINIPIIAIVLNVLRQLASTPSFFRAIVLTRQRRFCLVTSRYHQRSSILFLSLAQLQRTAMTRWHFSLSVGERFVVASSILTAN